MSGSGRVTPGSSLEQLKQEAKRWLKALRGGVETARRRFDSALPDFPRVPTLRDVQHALARELGFSGWTALKETKSRHAERPTVAAYDAMAHRLLDAYRTGTADAMERHYADTWHRREWSGMRSYVLADLGIHRADGAPFPDITLDDARRWVAYDHQFRGWDDLVTFVTTLKPEQRNITRSPVGASHRNGRDGDRVVARDWDSVIDAIDTGGFDTVNAHGQMTDAVLARITKLPSVKYLWLHGSKQLTDDGILMLASMPQLQILDIGGTQLTDRGVAVLRELPNLERINVGGTRITDACGPDLASCQSLQAIEMMWTQSGDGVIRSLAGHAALRQLITGVTVTDRGLADLAGIPPFRTWHDPSTSLDVRGMFTDTGLAHLAGLQGLFSLYYQSGDPGLTSRGLEPLALMEHLRALSGDFDDAAMAIIGGFPALNRLGCQDTEAGDDGWVALSRSRTIESIWGRRCYGLRDRGFRALATMPSLRNLRVSCRNVSDDALAVLPDFPALRELMPIDVPDAGYRHIGRCDQLEGLTLMYCRDTGDEATSNITGLDHLRRYFASYTQITDRTPELLATMRGLEEIEFSAISKLTDAGVAALARSKSLRRLSVDGSPLVTPAAKAAFGPEVNVTIG